MSDRLNEDVKRCKDQPEDLNSSHLNRLLSPSETGCKFLFSFVLFFIFNTNLFAKAQNNVINFNEEFKESSYQLNAEFYADPDFNFLLPENYNFTTADIIYIQIVPEIRPLSRISLVIENYWATPSSSADDANKYVMIENRCPRQLPFYFEVNENGQTQRLRLQNRVFKFPSSSTLYLHFVIKFCVDSCEKNCGSRRRRHVSWVRNFNPTLSKRINVVNQEVKNE